MTVRTRMAPSPTGHFHIGGARTALFDYLYAKQNDGKFVLRIEDTDQKRSRPEHVIEIMSALMWLGLAWDEGPVVGGPNKPYIQSERKDAYQYYALLMIATGHAYRCFCTKEQLDLRHGEGPRKYDGTCRDIDQEKSLWRSMAGEPFVVRFKAPRVGTTVVRDQIAGEITVDNSTIDDSILVKSDGVALYHLAAMVDDQVMGITDVFRGNEWLPSLPLHALIIRSFGWKEPRWHHLGVFLKPSGKGKMSKRDATSEQSIFVLGLRDLGYLPEAVLNWLALMGTSFGAEERPMDLAEMVKAFDVTHLSNAPARVNWEKLDYFNRHYIKTVSDDALMAYMHPFFEAAKINYNAEILRRLLPVLRERMATVDEAVAMTSFLWEDRLKLDAAYLHEILPDKEACFHGLSFFLGAIAVADSEINPAEVTEIVDRAIRIVDHSMPRTRKDMYAILRYAITGSKVSLPLNETISAMGRGFVMRRVLEAICLFPENYEELKHASTPEATG